MMANPLVGLCPRRRPDARAQLRAQRRERFFSDLVDPMVAQAKLLGIPLAEVVRRIQKGEETS